MKQKVYGLHDALEELGRAMARGRPRKYIWVESKQGPVKILNPKPLLEGASYGIAGDVEVRVKPRYQVTFSV